MEKQYPHAMCTLSRVRTREDSLKYSLPCTLGYSSVCKDLCSGNAAGSDWMAVVTSTLVVGVAALAFRHAVSSSRLASFSKASN